ncbi:MAG: VTT domain-containing protein [Thermodesulfobacteriota bacterium]
MRRPDLIRLAIVGLFATLAGLFFVLGLHQHLSLAALQASQARLLALYQASPWLVLGLYALAYILVTALSLPGAAAMSLAGGALFGLGAGVLVVSFASSIGATLACAVARFLLRDWVAARLGDRLAAMDEGIRREGAFYLFGLRLVPIFPFFVINLAMGLTPIPLRTFYWVSQLGMLPATVVYINAGQELARLDSLAGILSPRLLIAFALLGLAPLGLKRLLAVLKGRRRG